MSTPPTTRDPGAAQLRTALSSAPRPRRASAVSAALTFAWRGMMKVRHVPEQLMDATLTPVLFVLSSPTCSAERSPDPSGPTATT
jgi:ABC-2 type transport system permease protein